MKDISNVIIEKIKESNSLTGDEEVVRFGLEIMIEKAIFIVIVLVLGSVSRCFLEVIVFSVCFTLLREYGGGYHAETRKKCFVLSILTLVASLSIIKLAESFQILTLPICIAAFISALYILLKAPIDTPNKRFDEDDVKIFGRKARLLTVVLLAAAILLWVLKLSDFTFTVLTGIIVEAYLMLKGQISNSINREEV